MKAQGVEARRFLGRDGPQEEHQERIHDAHDLTHSVPSQNTP